MEETKSDLEKARAIVARRERWVGAPGVLEKNIANAIVEGIALGRKEGLQLALRIIESAVPSDDIDE